jgi:hypothetical protein
MCLRLITSSLVDDMTSSSEEDILVYMWLKLYVKEGKGSGFMTLMSRVLNMVRRF